MTNFESREWVEGALAFWRTARLNRLVSQRTIDWNIVELTKALVRLDRETC